MSILRRISNLLFRSRLAADAYAELQAHIDMRVEENLARGMAPDEARRDALLRFGNPAQMKERVIAADALLSLDELARNVRYAVRQFLRSPGFALTAILTLALGIGASTAIFSVVKAVLLNPLPYRLPGQLVHLWEGSPGTRYRLGDEAYFSTARPGSFLGWQRTSNSFDSMSAFRWRPMLLQGGDRADLVNAQEVYRDFFETLGTPPYLGRTLRPADYQPGSERVVVLSFGMWKERFGADPQIIGRCIALDRAPYEVVGVMPREFFPPAARRGGLWMPHWASQGEENDWLTWGLIPFARLKSGVTWEQAQSELVVLSNRIADDHPTQEKTQAVVVPMAAQLIGSTWKLLLLLSSGVALLFLIACVNVSNLLLARAVDREKEFAVRTALGAGRARLAVQLLVESLLFAFAAAAVGLGIGCAGIHWLLALVPAAQSLPRLDFTRLDAGTLAFVGGLTLLTSLALSLIPLLRALRNRTNETLKMEGRSASAGKRRRLLGQVFIVSEYVLCLVLLILGTSLVQNFVKLEHADPGFDADHLLVFHITVPDVKYGKFTYGQPSPARERLFEHLESALDAIPGIESAAVTERLPLLAEVNPSPAQIMGHSIPPSGSEGEASTESVNPAFMRALRLKLLQGRFFNEHDDAHSPLVAVVNQAFVQKFLPHENPIGKRAKVWYGDAVIVGVIADFRFNGLDRIPFPEIFWSLRQSQAPNVWIMARSSLDPSLAADAVRQKIQSVDPDLPVIELHPMREVVADSLWRRRLTADLLAVVAALAILLAAAGIYAVMSYSVNQRRKEIGIRMAFGANRGDVFTLVMREACILAMLASALGFAAAFFAGRMATSMVYLSPGLASTQPRDPLNLWTFIASSLFLFAVAIFASYAPARRALRVDPSTILQHE